MRFFCLILFLSLLNRSFGQDTIRIYFEYGKSKVLKKEEKKINNFQYKYDLSSVEKIQFIGYADSTGNLKSNLKLSLKRAENVLGKCKSFMGDSISTELLAKGESNKSNLEENRRVDIILHYMILQPEKIKDTIQNADPKCFFVDFQALEYCNIKEIIKGKRKYISIEAMIDPIFTSNKHYYVIQGTGGKYTIRKITWKKKKTGKLWWKRERLVTTLPKESFEKFQFFTLENPPCNGCKEKIFTKDTIIMNTLKYYPDHFIMHNMQVSLRIFKFNEVKIRVPKEYVDLNEPYYMSYRVDQYYYPYSSTKKVNWTTKKFGKKKDYYYANLPIYDNQLPWLYHERLTTTCLNKFDYTLYRRFSLFRCGGLISGSFPWRMTLEPGAFYHNDSLTAFLTVGLENRRIENLNLQIGINSRMGLYSALNYKAPIFSFRLKALNPNNAWVSPIEMKNAYSSIMELYLGTEGRISFNKNYLSFFEGNIHAGLQIRTRLGSIFPTYYLHGGAGYDFLNRINDKIYPYIQTGIRVYLF